LASPHYIHSTIYFVFVLSAVPKTAVTYVYSRNVMSMCASVAKKSIGHVVAISLIFTRPTVTVQITDFVFVDLCLMFVGALKIFLCFAGASLIYICVHTFRLTVALYSSINPSAGHYGVLVFFAEIS
jgi:hypothetical protein